MVKKIELDKREIKHLFGFMEKNNLYDYTHEIDNDRIIIEKNDPRPIHYYFVLVAIIGYILLEYYKVLLKVDILKVDMDKTQTILFILSLFGILGIIYLICKLIDGIYRYNKKYICIWEKTKKKFKDTKSVNTNIKELMKE